MTSRSPGRAAKPKRVAAITADLLEAVRIPCVLVDALHDRLPHLVIDDVAGGAMATRHLVDLGHERIAFIGDKPPDEYRFDSSRDRTRGFQQALAGAGLPVRDGYVREGTPSRHVARAKLIDDGIGFEPLRLTAREAPRGLYLRRGERREHLIAAGIDHGHRRSPVTSRWMHRFDVRR